jgi:hypothetical protein
MVKDEGRMGIRFLKTDKGRREEFSVGDSNGEVQ